MAGNLGGRPAHTKPAALPRHASRSRRPRLPLKIHRGDDYARLLEQDAPSTDHQIADIYEAECSAASAPDVAAFLGQAGNSYDELVSALEEAARYIANGTEGDPPAVLVKINRALEKARTLPEGV